MAQRQTKNPKVDLFTYQSRRVHLPCQSGRDVDEGRIARLGMVEPFDPTEWISQLGLWGIFITVRQAGLPCVCLPARTDSLCPGLLRLSVDICRVPAGSKGMSAGGRGGRAKHTKEQCARFAGWSRGWARREPARRGAAEPGHFPPSLLSTQS